MKALVETDPGSWPVLLGQPTGPTEAIDADIATVTGAADKVLRVAAAVPYLLLLEQLLKRVRTAANWQELLGEPKSAPAKRRRRPS